MAECETEAMSLYLLSSNALPRLLSKFGIDQETVRKGWKALQRCEEMICGLGLSSANDTKYVLAWLTTISLAICKAFDLLEMLKKEDVLSAMKERQLQEGDGEILQSPFDERTKKAEAWHRDTAALAPHTRPLQTITVATFAQDVIEGRAKVSQTLEHKHHPLMFGPASLVGENLSSDRERMAARVFQPGYRLPTMSIEEAGLREMEIISNLSI